MPKSFLIRSMVERLYGVEHGRSLSFAGINISGTESPVAPSTELMADLLSLPKGSSVGVEYASEFFEPFKIDEIEINVDWVSNFYWRRILRTCHIAKLEPIYLEDFDTYKKYTRKLLEVKAIEQHIADQYYKNADFFNSEEAKQLEAKHYVADVEAQYLLVVEREAKLVEKIKKTNPTIVILGKGHTEYLTQNPQLPTSNPLFSAKYIREIVYESPWSWHEELPHIKAGIDHKGDVNQEILLNRELLERQYRALKEGRITQGSKPDYIGTWDTDLEARGLFEVFVEGSRFGGKIEDALGTAVFEGTITDSEVLFVKAYDPEISSPEALTDPVCYTGNLVNGQYEGHYETRNNTNKSRKFTLQRFT